MFGGEHCGLERAPDPLAVGQTGFTPGSMENHCNVAGFLGWYFFNKSLSIPIVCHHDLHTLLKRWLENKILHFLVVFFFSGSAPKEKTHLIYYSVYNVKCGVITCVQSDVLFHMIAVGIVWTLLLRFLAGPSCSVVRFDMFQQSQQDRDGEECYIPIAALKLCLRLFRCF